MDLGVVGFDGLVDSKTGGGTGATCVVASDPETKQKPCIPVSYKKLQERPDIDDEEDVYKSSKLARTDDSFSAIFNNDLLKSTGSSLFPTSGHQNQVMLSFSGANSEGVDATLPCFPLSSSSTFSPYSRNTGYNNSIGFYNGPSMQYESISGFRGTITQSQWIELEHQILIYKHISSNMPIPPQLLLPIIKSFASCGYTGFHGGLFRTDAWGFGGFGMGYGSSTDPEPGRCRRTDGKKWRCARDAMPEQKYCERHMNRGRHRSRKPVEGRFPAHSSTTTTTATATAQKGLQQPGPAKSLASLASQPTTDRTLLSTDGMGEKAQEKPDISIVPPRLERFPKQELGLISSASPPKPINLAEEEAKAPHSLLQLIEDWPRNQPSQTQLSKSSGITSTSSAGIENLSFCPLRLSCELDPAQPARPYDANQSNWVVPITWGGSLGGPLGEVLNRSAGGSGDKNLSAFRNLSSSSSGLNLLTDGWDKSCQSSPTGVLQKTAFGSVSNSSAGSSPRASESNVVHEGASFLVP